MQQIHYEVRIFGNEHGFVAPQVPQVPQNLVITALGAIH